MRQGLKLREMKFEYDSIAWPNQDLSYHAVYLYGAIQGECIPRMKLLECRATNVRGYYAYVVPGLSTVKLIVDKIENSQDVSSAFRSNFYGDWMHLPLDEDEYVEDIWVARFEQGGGIAFLVSVERTSTYSVLLSSQVHFAD